MEDITNKYNRMEIEDRFALILDGLMLCRTITEPGVYKVPYIISSIVTNRPCEPLKELMTYEEAKQYDSIVENNENMQIHLAAKGLDEDSNPQSPFKNWYSIIVIRIACIGPGISAHDMHETNYNAEVPKETLEKWDGYSELSIRHNMSKLICHKIKNLIEASKIKG